jgi:hypothetical protein
MDISGTIQCVLDEFELCESEAMSIAFQNHLYGCFSIIEQHTENGSVLLDLSNTDISNSNPWTTLGIDYGFLEDTRAVYAGSDRYRSVMTDLLLTLWTDEQVEELEQLVFEFLKQRDAKYFVAALEEQADILNSAINAFVTPKLQEAIIDPKPKSHGKQFNKTVHNKHEKHLKPLSKTRKRKNII